MDFAFTKMEGCGNDYVYLHLAEAELPDWDFGALARAVSPRHTAVGADGLIVVRSAGERCIMDMWNADGSRGELCVNGLRCAALLAVQEDPSRALEFVMETGAGPIPVRVSSREREAEVLVWLKPPRILGRDTYAPGGLPIPGIRVDTGNPHCVFWVSSEETLEDVPLEEWGPRIQEHPHFPDSVNVHFAFGDGDEAWVRHYERGSGVTLACGSGAVATWAVAREKGFPADPLTVIMPGGSVRIRPSGEQVVLSGPARHIFSGTFSFG